MADSLNSAQTTVTDPILDGLVGHTSTEFIDDTVTKLANNALAYNEMLVTVSLPNVTSSGDSAFAQCGALVNVSLAALESIGASTFQSCLNLQNVQLPSLREMGSSAFRSCTSLQSITFPATLTALYSSAFNNCTQLETVIAPGVTRLYDSVFSGCLSLQTYSFPNVTRVDSTAFANAPLPVVELPSCTTIGAQLGQGNGPTGFDFTQTLTIPANAFTGYNVQHIVLRSSTLCPLSNISAFSSSPISLGCGYIYVPSDLVATYKAATNWSTYADQILPLSEYPKTPTGSITDTWSEIFAAEANGTYSTKYAIGDTKVVLIDNKPVLMEIVAMDTDTLSDNTGTAKITWLSVGIIEQRPIHSTNSAVDGWAQTSLRDYLRNTLYPTIDATVRTGIKEVTKTYRIHSPSDTTLSVADTIWIPSCKEVNLDYASSVETNGVIYTDKFTSNNTTRIKHLSNYGLGNTLSWWLRSADSSIRFALVGQTGTIGRDSPTSTAVGVVIGFCT